MVIRSMKNIKVNTKKKEMKNVRVISLLVSESGLREVVFRTGKVVRGIMWVNRRWESWLKIYTVFDLKTAAFKWVSTPLEMSPTLESKQSQTVENWCFQDFLRVKNPKQKCPKLEITVELKQLLYLQVLLTKFNYN